MTIEIGGLTATSGDLATIRADLSVARDFGTVANQAAMIALSTAVSGSTCYRTDTSSLWILKATPYSTAGNWYNTNGNLDLLTGLSNAASNRAIIQAALNGGGSIYITQPGTYYVDTVLSVYSNTSVYIGAGVTLKTSDGVASAVFTNSAARGTPVTATSGNVTYATAPDGINYCAQVSNLSAVDAGRFPVGSYVSVVVLGHAALGAPGTAVGGRGYRGVWRVLAQTINGAASQIKYHIQQGYPGAGGNSINIYPADENIKIWGLGTIDGNGGAASQAYLDGDPRGCVMWWRHVINITVEGLRFKRGTTWTIGSNYVRNYVVRDIVGDLRDPATFSTIDFVHLSGNHQNVLIADIDVAAGDNAIGMTIDCTESTAYNFPYQHPGDMYDITINNVTLDSISEDGNYAMIGIYGPEAYIYRNIVIDGVSGYGNSVVQLATYSTTNQYKLVIDRISISNVRAMVNSALIILAAGSVSIPTVYSIGELVLDGIVTPLENIPVLAIGNTYTSGNIRSLIMRNCTHWPYDGSTFTRTAQLATFGGVNIGALQISNTEGIVMGANIKCFEANGAGNIPKIGIRDCSATGSGTAHLWGDTGGGTAAAPVYNNSTYNGTTL